MSLRWSSYVAPKPASGEGSKTQNGRFPGKIARRLKKVCYKVSLCENCQRQSCRAFIGPTNRAKMIGGERPLQGHRFKVQGHRQHSPEMHFSGGCIQSTDRRFAAEEYLFFTSSCAVTRHRPLCFCILLMDFDSPSRLRNYWLYVIGRVMCAVKWLLSHCMIASSIIHQRVR